MRINSEVGDDIASRDVSKSVKPISTLNASVLLWPKSPNPKVFR